MYDNANRMTSQTWQFGTGLYRQQYTYTGQNSDGKQVDGTISAITTTIPGRSAITSTYKYNDLRQLEKKTVTGPDQNGKQTKVYDRSYTYDRIAADSGCNWMGTRLASTGYTFGSNSRSFTYTYDDSGNITKVVTAGTKVPKAATLKEYGYDAQGQLVSEKNGSGTTFLYAYDTAGNIRSITKDGAVIKSFGYTNPSWPDLLTSVTVGGTTKDILYEGQTQTSDVPSSGNPVTYYNGKDYTFTWTKGRQLASATVDGKQISYTYDMSGVRTSKTVDGTTYNYTTLSGKVMRQTWGNKSLEFVYDDGSQPFAMIYKHGSETELYYYLVNAQGDVSAILDSGGKIAASYDYDAWGNCTVYDSSDAAIGDLNPLRYRGYYYDAETGFYYLQSRYYDFANCRFINADGLFADSFIGTNLFAYCMNNPVNMSDHTGHWPQWLKNVASTVVNAVKKAGTVVVNTVKSVVSSVTNIVKASSNSLPPKGEPGSSKTLPNPDGTPKQKRWYGPDGNPERDRDYNHPGNMPFPHDHRWKNGERGKDHLPPDPSYKMNWEPVIGVGLVTVCVVGIIAVAADDATGIGVADDFLFGPLGAGVGEGLILIFG